MERKFVLRANFSFIINANRVNLLRYQKELNDDHKAAMAIFENLRSKLSETKSKDERMLLLSLAPRFWSRTNLIERLGCTEWETRTILTEATDGNILMVPLKNKGKELSNETKNTVKNFTISVNYCLE